MRLKIHVLTTLLAVVSITFAIPISTYPAFQVHAAQSVSSPARTPADRPNMQEVAPLAAAAPAIVPTDAISLSVLGTYATGIYSTERSAAEIPAYDPASKRLFVVNGYSSTVDVLNVANPAAPTLVTSIAISPTYGASPNSVAVKNGIVAVAVEAAPKTDPGYAVFFDTNGAFLSQVQAGALPDMITFSPDGRYALTANEGEPNADYSIDPEGSVSVIDVSGGAASLTQANVTTLNFTHFTSATLDPRIRITGPNATIAQDIEPEYVAVAPDSATAYVTLQENNAIAVVSMTTLTITQILATGYKDHSLAANAFDASDRDNRINITNWPTFGMFQPDGIAAYQAGDLTYLITANEGDSRDYSGFSEERRIGSITLDPTAFPNAATLQQQANLGRLNVTTATNILSNAFSPDTNGDGDIDVLYPFGARSFSIWSSSGTLVFDSGDQIERIISDTVPAWFNSDATGGFDTRSDNKGPEPESVTVGRLNGRDYAFIALERIGGVMVYDVSNPVAPTYVQWANNRVYTTTLSPVAKDLGPEGLIFIPAAQSPNGKPLLVVANEVSGSTTIHQIDVPTTLTVLHNNDGESALLPQTQSVPPGWGGLPNTATLTLPFASAAALKSVADTQRTQARGLGNSVLTLNAGDIYLPSAVLQCSLPVTSTGPFYDAIAQRQIGYDTITVGNHEFDLGPDLFQRFIRDFRPTATDPITIPFVSSNLDFSAQPGFADLIDADGIVGKPATDNRVIGRSSIVTDALTGEIFGVVGATPPDLASLTSPGSVVVSTTLTDTAQAVQTEINRLLGLGVNKIVYTGQLQAIAQDRELIKRVSGIDVFVSGGGGELLLSTAVPTTTQLVPGNTTPVFGTYPITQTDAAGRTVYIVTTNGSYRYLGRFDAQFNTVGEVSKVVTETSYIRRVIPTSGAASQLGLPDAVTPDATIVSSVETPLNTCLRTFASTTLFASQVPLSIARADVRAKEANGGNLIADSFIHAYDQLATINGLPPRSANNRVVAVQNGGGIRDTVSGVYPRDPTTPTVSLLDTLDVLPFANFVTVVTNVTPSDVKSIFERSASQFPSASGGFLQVSGITVTYRISNPVNSRVWGVSLADGTPVIAGGVVISSAPSISIVTNDFTATGGDGYTTLQNNPNRTRLKNASDALISYGDAWRSYMQTFPLTTVLGQSLPTVLSSDKRYRPGGEGRILFARSFWYVPFIPNERSTGGDQAHP